ncbi:MAG: SusD/RagB family nutrient-binding outer membrane lipoprotein, partial [Bacteroidota bacterium]
MNTIKKISIIALLGAAVFSTGCKKFLDVNTNPNVVYGPQVSLVLPSAQMYVASAVGCNLQINGSIWAQYWTQSPLASQYKILEQYFPSGSNYDNSWALMYSQALPDLKYVEKTGTATNFKQYIAISKLMQAYMFQLATDAWGDIPFSEAGKGEVADGGITSPRYDAQSSIYDGIIKLINDATVLISNTDPNKPTTDDLVYGGNMNNWLAFANTLKLKVYLRLSEVDSVKAKAGIA